MASFSTIHFYQILHDIGLAMPAVYESDDTELICKRINSFAVLQTEDEINSGALNKSNRYIGKRLFFSRRFLNSGQQISQLSFQYPLLAISNATSTISGAFCEPSESCKTFNLYIFDQLPGKCSDCNEHGYCNTRTWEEMETDLEELLMKVTKSIGRFGYYEYEKDGVPMSGWFDLCYIDELIESGAIDNAECVENLHASIKDINEPKPSDTFFEAFNDNLGMIAITFTVCFSTCKEDEKIKMDYSNVPFELADEGCTTC